MRNSMILYILFSTFLLSQEADFTKLTDPYLGQKPPGMTPEVFAPGIVSLEGYHDFKGAFSPDGKEYYFCRHALPEVIPTLTRSGTIYFQSRRPGGIGNSDIYRAELVDGRYVKAECLPEPVNSRGFEGDALIAPDESYIIVSASRGPQPMAADLYISFRTAEGKWTDLVNMCTDINGPGGENCQILSPCGKYLFFTGRRYNPEKVPATYVGLRARHNGSLNGLSDSFWVSTKIIEELRPKE